MLRFLQIFFTFSVGMLYAAEDPLLKAIINMPVFYQLHVEGTVKTDGKEPKINFRSFSIDGSFSLLVKSDEHYPVIMITPTKFEGSLQFNQGKARFDFSQEQLTFNHILMDAFPILNEIKLNQAIQIPITDNLEFLRDAKLPMRNPEAYANLSKKIMNFLENGLLIKQGKSHVHIPELNLEIFSNEKIVGDQLRGEHIFRFFSIPDNVKKGCQKSFTGGGKVSNRTLPKHVLHTNAQGIFLLLFESKNCSSKELNERYEVKGKFLLTPKPQAISPLT